MINTFLGRLDNSGGGTCIRSYLYMSTQANNKNAAKLSHIDLVEVGCLIELSSLAYRF